MKHLGDITKLSGYAVPPVDIITGGSPCQDLSVAGKRAGLAGERSGLFMEQIRIIKEMRENDIRNGRTDEHIRPRFMVWENVPGAFSSNKGDDFRAVLEETVKVVCPDAVIPQPPKGKWTPCGCIVGDGWSVAWRVHDAQFWGVPQRRKRICLLADWGGDSAGKILFELWRETEHTETDQTVSNLGEESRSEVQPFSQSVSGNIEPSRTERKGITEDVERGTDSTSYTLKIRGGAEYDRYGKRAGKGDLVQTELSGTLGVSQDQTLIQGFPLGFRAENTKCYDEKATTICNGTRPGFTCGVIQGFDAYNQAMTGNVAKPLTNKAIDSDHIPIVYHKKGHPQNAEQGQGWEETGVNDTLNAFDSGETRTPTLIVDQGGGKSGCHVAEDVSPTLATTHGGEPVVLENHPQDSKVKLREDGIFQTLDARMGMGGGNVPMVMEYNPTYVFGRQHDVTFDDKSPSLCAKMGTGGNNVPMIMKSNDGDTAGTLDASYYKGCGERQGVERTVVCVGNGQLAQARLSSTVGTLNCMHDQQAILTYGLDRASFNQGKNAKFDFSVDEEKVGTCVAKGLNAVCKAVDCRNATKNEMNGSLQAKASNSLNNNNVCRVNSVVRRLTPLECERLQGFPDHWTDIGEWTDSKGKKHKDADSPRYKALGNSIALPFWEWMAERMIKQLNKEKPTMASLFDGIGGFPLVFSRHGCEPVWASEIEEFPMAVTERRFENVNTDRI